MDWDFNQWDSFIDAQRFFENIGVEKGESVFLVVKFSENLKHLNELYEVKWSISDGFDSHVDIDIDELLDKDFHPNYNSNLQQMTLKGDTLVIEGYDKNIRDYKLTISKPE